MSDQESSTTVRHRGRPNDLNITAKDVKSEKKSKGSHKRQKEAAILRALRADPVDISALRQAAISREGLLNNQLREQAWPKLLDVDPAKISPKPDAEVLQGHRDYNQVVLDVNRSLKRFPPGMETEHRMSLQDQLVDVIMRVLVAHPELHYYQGFHDICVTFLLVVGEDLAFGLVEKLSLHHLRDFMDETMERTKQSLNYLYPIIDRANPELCAYLEKADLGNVFCLSWLITWYGHVLGDLKDILRLYDFFIACHPLMPIYLAAAIVLHREKEIYAVEYEMCFMHSLLTKIPDTLPFEKLLAKAGDLFLQFSPVDLANDAIKRSQKSAQEQATMNARRRQMAVSRNPSSRAYRFTLWTLSTLIGAAAVYVAYTSASHWRWMEWEHWI